MVVAGAGLAFDDTLPPSLTLVSVQASVGSCSNAGNAIHCDIGTLATRQQSAAAYCDRWRGFALLPFPNGGPGVWLRPPGPPPRLFVGIATRRGR
jgi:hypothetical protein